MLSKRSLALTSVAYNLAAILTNLLVDILAPGPFESLPVRPVRANDYVGMILTRAVQSSAKHRPSFLINSATREGQQFVLQSVYGSRNIAWPWFIRYATDYSYGWPVWHLLHLYDYGQRIVFMSFLLNLLLTAGAVAAFAGVSRRALHSVVVADLATILFFLATPLWTIDPLSPFPLASFLAIFGFYLYEGGSAQFAGAFLISISAICPGAFFHGTCAILSFAKNVLNFITSTWSDFWKRSWSSRIFVALPKATIYVYWILFQSGMALIGYLTFSVVFFFLNRVGRADNMVGDSTYNFKSINGRAAKLTEYAKLPIQYLTVSQFGEAESITKHHALWSKIYSYILFFVLCPLIVSVARVCSASFWATIKRRKNIVYVFRRPEKRFWKFIPHALIFFGTVLHALSHRHVTDALLLLSCNPIVFWSAALLARRNIRITFEMLRTSKASAFISELCRHNSSKTALLGSAFMLQPVFVVLRTFFHV